MRTERRLVAHDRRQVVGGGGGEACGHRPAAPTGSIPARGACGPGRRCRRRRGGPARSAPSWRRTARAPSRRRPRQRNTSWNSPCGQVVSGCERRMFSAWLVPPRWIPSRKIGPPVTRGTRPAPASLGKGRESASIRRPRAPARAPRIKVLMHILFFAENSPYLAIRVGGAENSMRLMAEGLAARGHHVSFASLRPDLLPGRAAVPRERGRGGAPPRHPPVAAAAAPPPPRPRRGPARPAAPRRRLAPARAGALRGRDASTSSMPSTRWRSCARRSRRATGRSPDMRIVMRMAGLGWQEEVQRAGAGAGLAEVAALFNAVDAINYLSPQSQALVEARAARARGAAGAPRELRGRHRGGRGQRAQALGRAAAGARARDRGGDALLALPEAPGPAGGGARARSGDACPSG